jgi:hypothetical protein
VQLPQAKPTYFRSTDIAPAKHNHAYRPPEILEAFPKFAAGQAHHFVAGLEQSGQLFSSAEIVRVDGIRVDGIRRWVSIRGGRNQLAVLVTG